MGLRRRKADRTSEKEDLKVCAIRIVDGDRGQ